MRLKDELYLTITELMQTYWLFKKHTATKTVKQYGKMSGEERYCSHMVQQLQGALQFYSTKQQPSPMTGVMQMNMAD